MGEISGAIAEGARAFLFAEYRILVIFVGVLFLLIGFFIGWGTGLCFLAGAAFSVGAGHLGMRVATKANVRAAAGAKDGSYVSAVLGVEALGGLLAGAPVFVQIGGLL